MKLSEAIILGRALVEGNRAGEWETCALGGAHKAVTGKTAHNCGDLIESFPSIWISRILYNNQLRVTGCLIYELYDEYVVNGSMTIEQLADIIKECGDLDSVNYNNSGNSPAEKTSSHCPSPEMSVR